MLNKAGGLKCSLHLKDPKVIPLRIAGISDDLLVLLLGKARRDQVALL